MPKKKSGRKKKSPPPGSLKRRQLARAEQLTGEACAMPAAPASTSTGGTCSIGPDRTRR